MGSPAVKLLQGMIDGEGRFWYPSAKAGLVRDFYATCKAKCALSGDWYDTGWYAGTLNLRWRNVSPPPFES